MSKVTVALAALDREQQLRIFDAATRRQAERQAANPRHHAASGNRGWTREELYRRGGAG